MTKDQRTNLIKRLLYKSNYRGCKETDLILGNFAKEHIKTLTDEELQEFALILGQNDPDIWDWLNQYKAIPNEISKDLISKISKTIT
jgi:antitoxin CptB